MKTKPHIHDPACCDCGAPVSEVTDFAFGLPDVIYALDDETQEKHVQRSDDFCSYRGAYFFVRCLLAIPTPESPHKRFCFGVWVAVSESVLWRCDQAWRDEKLYAKLKFTGRLANNLDPWLGKTVGTEVAMEGRGFNERPYIVKADHPDISKALKEGWKSTEHERVAQACLAWKGAP